MKENILSIKNWIHKKVMAPSFYGFRVENWIKEHIFVSVSAVIVETLIFMGYECTRVVRLNLNSHRAGDQIAALFTIAVNNNSHNKHNRRSLIMEEGVAPMRRGEGASSF